MTLETQMDHFILNTRYCIGFLTTAGFSKSFIVYVIHSRETFVFFKYDHEHKPLIIAIVNEQEAAKLLS